MNLHGVTTPFRWLWSKVVRRAEPCPFWAFEEWKDGLAASSDFPADGHETGTLTEGDNGSTGTQLSRAGDCRLAAPSVNVPDYDRLAERRYETWLETLKDHGP